MKDFAMNAENVEETAAFLNAHQTKNLERTVCRNIVLSDRYGKPAVPKVAPWLLVRAIRQELKENGIALQSLSLEGSAASHCLEAESVPHYNDLDFVFHLGQEAALHGIRSLVIKVVTTFLPPQQRAVMSEYDVGETFVAKQFITGADENQGDAWAIYTLSGVQGGPALDLKFVQRLNRPYQFSADSFQIVLDDSKLDTYLQQLCGVKSCEDSGEACVPSRPKIKFRSSFFAMDVALDDLSARKIGVQAESDIACVRGGGLLKYARFCAQGWDVEADVDRVKLQRYMCVRFIMDYPHFQTTRFGVPVQLQRLCDFVETHLPGACNMLRPHFFNHLRRVVVEASVPDSGALLKAVHNAAFVMMQGMSVYPQQQQQQQRLPSTTTQKKWIKKKVTYTTHKVQEPRKGGRPLQPMQPMQACSVPQLSSQEDAKLAIIEPADAVAELLRENTASPEKWTEVVNAVIKAVSPSKKKRSSSKPASMSRGKSYAAALTIPPADEVIATSAVIEPVR